MNHGDHRHTEPRTAGRTRPSTARAPGDKTSQADHHLAAIGLSPEAEALYRRLLLDGASPLPSPCAEVDELEGFGFVIRDDTHVIPMPPRLAVMNWTREQEARIAQAAFGADLLATVKRRESGAAPSYLELIPGATAARIAFSEIQRTARHEICALDRGTYLPPSDPAYVSPEQPPAMQAGVRYQVIYHRPSLAVERNLRTVRDSIELGEEARVFPHVPIKMLVADRALALLVLQRPGESALLSAPASTDTGSEPPQDADVDALLVHPSSLLDSLIALFDVMWDLSIPMSSDTEPTAADSLPPQLREVLRLLATGLTDSAIARELSVSERTVQRRVEALQTVLGASSRFLMGAQAARRGWL